MNTTKPSIRTLHSKPLLLLHISPTCRPVQGEQRQRIKESNTKRNWDSLTGFKDKAFSCLSKEKRRKGQGKTWKPLSLKATFQPQKSQNSPAKKKKLSTKKISEKNGNSHHSLPGVISRLHQI